MSQTVMFNDVEVKVTEEICWNCGENIIYYNGKPYHIWEDVYPNSYDHTANPIPKREE